VTKGVAVILVMKGDVRLGRCNRVVHCKDLEIIRSVHPQQSDVFEAPAASPDGYESLPDRTEPSAAW
jgi:hypothetical protein